MKILRLFAAFLRDLYISRRILWQLTKRDYKNAYIGSFFGVVWSIIQPVVLIFVLWLMFSIGFRSGGKVEGIPFIAYLTFGIIVWNFFSAAFSSTTVVFSNYSYLVKKLNFKVAVLPLVKIFSATLTHFVFLCVGIIILLISGVHFSLYWFQFIYYLFALIVLLMALGWITSSLQIFAKDTVQFVKVLLSFGFWFSPIIWNIENIPLDYQVYLKINPLFYILNGYRNSFLYGRPFWEDLLGMAVYWGFVFVMLILAVFVFSRLRPHFSDVL